MSSGDGEGRGEKNFQMLHTVWSLEDCFEGRKKKGCIKQKCTYMHLLVNWPEDCDQKQETLILFSSGKKEEVLL